MTVTLVVRMGLFAVGLALFISGLSLRNRGGDKRCPQCRYNLAVSATQRCSECGYAWTTSEELLRRPRRKWRIIIGSILLTLALLLPLFTAKHWTERLSHSILLHALDTFVEEPPASLGSALPAPDPALMHSNDRWERLVWQKQTARALERFLARVEQSNGTLDAVHALLPMAEEANDLFTQFGGTRWADAFPVHEVVNRARERAAEIDAGFELPLGTWAAAELQHLTDATIQQRQNWLAPPLEVLEPLARSRDYAAREYALRRLALIDDPAASRLIEAMVHDPDEILARQAAETLFKRREIRGWE